MLIERKLQVTYQSKTVDGKLLALGCAGPSFCGCDMIQDMNVAGVSVFHVARGQTSTGQTPKCMTDTYLEAILTEYTDLLEPGLVSLKEPPVKLQLREDATSMFLKVTPVPYTFRT